MPFWQECYASAFPTMIAMHDHRQDGIHQRQGIDRSIILKNGKTIWIDEKVRFRNKLTGKVYADIAVEEWSDERAQSPGWVKKQLFCDYIAYAIAPLGKCYLLPVVQLQTAWLVNGENWKQAHKPPVRAQNNGWMTISWAIPVPVLFKAIGDCLRVEFQPYDPPA